MLLPYALSGSCHQPFHCMPVDLPHSFHHRPALMGGMLARCLLCHHQELPQPLPHLTITITTTTTAVLRLPVCYSMLWYSLYNVYDWLIQSLWSDWLLCLSSTGWFSVGVSPSGGLRFTVHVSVAVSVSLWGYMLCVHLILCTVSFLHQNQSAYSICTLYCILHNIKFWDDAPIYAHLNDMWNLHGIPSVCMTVFLTVH